MELVNDKTVVEVGKFYLVTCAKMGSRYGEKFYYVPIYGEPHNDNQFGFPDKHYHIDGRFTGKYLADQLNINQHGLTNAVCSFEPSAAINIVKEVVVRKIKCLRLTTGINPPPGFEKDGGKYSKWYKDMIGKSCAGKKCPHLGTEMKERNGVLICPMHNLMGSVKKEVIIPFDRKKNVIK